MIAHLGTEDIGHSRTGLLGRVPASPRVRQHHRPRHQESLQDSKHSQQIDRQSQVKYCEILVNIVKYWPYQHLNLR
jgi:hypothetical protein